MISLAIGLAYIMQEWYIAYTIASRLHHVLTVFNDEDRNNENIDENGSPTDQLGLEITFASKIEKDCPHMLLIF